MHVLLLPPPSGLLFSVLLLPLLLQFLLLFPLYLLLLRQLSSRYGLENFQEPRLSGADKALCKVCNLSEAPSSRCCCCRFFCVYYSSYNIQMLPHQYIYSHSLSQVPDHITFVYFFPEHCHCPCMYISPSLNVLG